MRKVSGVVGALTVLAVMAVAAPGALAQRIEMGEHTHVNLDFLLQVQAQAVEKGAPDGDAWSTDFFLRRTRLLVSGAVWKDITFFWEVDQPNFGKGGKWDTAFFTQDAFMSFKVDDAFIVDVGMIILPFTRPSMQGAVGLSALDYHSGLIRFVEGSHKVWRDAGVQLRGYVADQKFQYRLGVFNGAQGTALQRDQAGRSVLTANPEDWPRVTGHVRYNILGKETDFFGKGIYFTAEPILSLGLGLDFQPDVVVERPTVLDVNQVVLEPGALRAALGIAADLFLDLPVADEQELVFQGAFFWYDHGYAFEVDALGQGTRVAHHNSGTGFLTEVGYRWRWLQPVFSADWFKSKQRGADLLALRGGVNFWIRKHAANIKAEFGAEKRGRMEDAPWTQALTVQAQLFF